MLNWSKQDRPYRSLRGAHCNWWRRRVLSRFLWPQQWHSIEQAGGWHCRCARNCMCLKAGALRGGERTNRR